jgi:hypothetical protein
MALNCSCSTKLYAGAALAIIIIGMLTGLAYTAQREALSDTLRGGLESTASVMATQVNASELAGLKPGDEGSPQYMAVAHRLKAMRSMDDHIVNAYILKVNPDRTISFLVDDLWPDDPQGSAKIGERSTAPDQTEIFQALSAPTSSKQPYTTKYGSFISAYAPVDDSVAGSGGNTYAVLAIDVTAKDYADYMSGKGNLILISGLVSIVLALLILACSGTKRNTAESGSKK